MSDPPAFTVFTATHDRVDRLPDAYESLRSQTTHDFEWLVVVDGRQPDATALLDGWAARAPFPIRVLQQPHLGKPAAYNRALEEAQGELFAVLDDDDTCAPHALATFQALWQSVPTERRAEFAGVGCCCRDQHGRRVSGPFPTEPFDASEREVRYVLGESHEKWGAMRTDILRSAPFPDLSPETHQPEGIIQSVWPELPTRWTSEILRTWWQHEGPTQLTRRPATRHARGHAEWHRRVLANDLSWFRHAPATFARSAANYSRFALLAGTNPTEQVRRLPRGGARVLWAVGLPVGAALAARDRGRERRGDVTTARRA